MSTLGEAPPVVRFVLVLTSPAELAPARLPIGSESVFIGRDADLTVRHATMSRRHARIWVSDGRLQVEDCGSTNGTFVNGRQVTGPTWLQVADTVTFGGVETFVALPESGSLAVPDRSLGTADTAYPTGPLPAAQSETTRYLCAATHLDPQFRHRVLRETINQPFRAVAPNYGMDVAPVARHAVAARRRELVRDTVLLAILVVTVVLLLRTVFAREQWTALTESDSQAVRVLLGNLWPGVMVVLAATWLAVAWETGIMLRVLTSQLTVRRFRPHAIAGPIGQAARRRLTQLAEMQAGNVVVFSDYEPFVGSGELLEPWSFAVDITKGLPTDEGDKRRTPRPFTEENLHRHLTVALHRVGMPNVVVGDRLFVDGRAVRADLRLLPNQLAPPVSWVDRNVLWELADTRGAGARVYLCCEVAGWRGQVVSTTFVRAMRFDGSLFVESSAFLLLPLANRYRAVDVFAGAPSSELVLHAALRGARLAVRLLLASPWRVGGAVVDMLAAMRRRRRDRRTIAEGWAFDYGARTSIRELAAGIDFRRYFQEMDGVMFHKVVQEALLRAIVEFLTAHDIDIEQVKAMQMVLNQNTVFNGKADFRGAQGLSFGSSTNNSTNRGTAPAQQAASK